jgi:hypothetical protein
VKTYPVGEPRAFDKLLAFQSIQHATHDPALIADKTCDLVGTSETSSVAAHENQYIPLTEQ